MRKKVLIVDDDPNILDGISYLLELEGYSTATTTKGEEAVKLARIFKPSIVLLDVLMSGSDGRDVCREFKRNSVLKTIPIIMVSAHPSVETATIECGAEHFLAKPFEIDELTNIIEKYTANATISVFAK